MKIKLFSIEMLVFSCMVIVSSCTAQFRIPVTKDQSIPSRYKADLDSSNIAEVSWKQYFSDPILVDLIDSTLARNLDLQIALQKIEISRFGVRMAKGATLPQIGLNMGGGLRKFGLYTMDGAGNISTEITPGKTVPINLPDMYVGLTASWEVDIWGKLKNQRKSAISNYLSSVEGANFIVSNLVAEVAISYYELLALDHELTILQRNILKQQEALETVKVQKEVGKTNELALQQFSANLLHSKILEKEVQQQIVSYESKINFLAGRYPQKINRNKDVLLIDTQQNLDAGLPSQLLANRPDIRRAAFLVEASKFDLKSAKAAFYPSLNITAALGFQAFNPQFLFNTPSSVAYNTLGNLALPLINRNALKAHFNIAKASQLMAVYEYQSVILNGFIEVSNELSNFQNLKERNELKKQQSTILRQSIETANDLFLVGKASYLEVLVVQQSSLQTELEFINNTKNQKISGVNIYKALGGGWK